MKRGPQHRDAITNRRFWLLAYAWLRDANFVRRRLNWRGYLLSDLADHRVPSKRVFLG